MSFLYCSCVLVGLLFFGMNKNSKSLAVVMIVSAVLLACAPRTGYDTDSFIRIYSIIQTDGVDVASSIFPVNRLYLELVNLSINLGIESYFVFKFIVLGILVTIVAILYRRISLYPVALLLLYFLSTFSSDAIQLRNTIALLLFLIGFSFFLREEKYGVFVFVLFNILAALFHSTFLIYLLLLFAKIDEKKLKIITKPVIAFTLLFYMISMVDRDALDFVTGLVDSGKFAIYKQSTTHLGSIIPVFLSLSQVLLLNHIHRKSPIEEDEERLQAIIIKNVFYLNLFLFPSVVLNLYTLSFDRIMRNLMLLNLVVFTNHLFSARCNEKNRWAYKSAILGLCVFYLVYLNFITGPADDILFAVLNGTFFWIE